MTIQLDLDLMSLRSAGLSNDHLSNSLAAKCLRSSELVTSNSGEKVEDRGEQHKHSGGNQTGGRHNQREPLNKAEHAVESRAHIICCESAHEDVKFG